MADRAQAPILEWKDNSNHKVLQSPFPPSEYCIFFFPQHNSSEIPSVYSQGYCYSIGDPYWNDNPEAMVFLYKGLCIRALYISM